MFFCVILVLNLLVSRIAVYVELLDYMRNFHSNLCELSLTVRTYQFSTGAVALYFNQAQRVVKTDVK